MLPGAQFHEILSGGGAVRPKEKGSGRPVPGAVRVPCGTEAEPNPPVGA